MAEVYAEQLINPGRYLLSLLRESPSIRYSEYFFDGTKELAEKLPQLMGVEDHLARQAPILVDLAVWQLAEQSFVQKTELEELMSDGEKDYRIELTEAGHALLATADTPEIAFRDMYL